MKSLSKLCIALSAAALLAGVLPGQALSQEGEGLIKGVLPNIASYRAKEGIPTSAEVRQATAVESVDISAKIDISRVMMGRDSNTEERSLLLSVTLTTKGKNGPRVITISDIPVRSNGLYGKRLEDGSRISGTVASFLDPAWSGKGISGTYTGSDGLQITYKNLQGRGRKGFHDPLSDMMFFDSWRYSIVDYIEYLEDFKTLRQDIARLSRQHLDRGKSIAKRRLDSSGKPNANFYAELRLYQDYKDANVEGPGFYAEQVENISCAGMSCEAVVEDEDTAAIGDRVQVLEPGHFLTEDSGKVRVVLLNQGIYLTLDSSRKNAIDSPKSFGAWMNHAGFFVATGGTYTDSVDGKDRAARMVVAAGERTGSRPAAEAVWRGSMVGTVLEGGAKDNILRSDAELTFTTKSSTLFAHFFNIRNYDKFGVKRKMLQDVEKGRKNRLAFRGIPVAPDGSYARTYDNSQVNSGGSISGAFYGTGHAETAGTFEKWGIAGAFGAKRVTAN